MTSKQDILNRVKNNYKYGFSTNIDSEQASLGLNEDIVRFISNKKKEPSWLLSFRLKALKHWKKLRSDNCEPKWANLVYPKIDFDNIVYYSAPKQKKQLKNISDVDPKILETYNRLGIPIHEQKRLSNVAIDAIFDSVSVITTFKKKLEDSGVIFCSFSEAVNKYSNIIKKYLGSVVPFTDNYFATLNSAVFSDGSFCYVSKNVCCPMELSTYFRINAANVGQFERTLIIAEDSSYVSYLEGCTAPMRDENQLHAAVVELVALDNAEIKYSTVQNWYPGDKDGNGGVLNFVTKRGLCKGYNSKISWTQIESGSAVTWKYPSCVLYGDNSSGEFYSVAVTNGFQQADTGSKMIHLGKNTSSIIISKGISLESGKNSYRGLVDINKKAEDARNYSQCDSLLFGSKCSAYTFPYIKVKNHSSQVAHEASSCKIQEEQLFYCAQRCISREDAIAMIVNGFCKTVFKQLPMEFAVEAQKLININIEDSVA